MSESSVITGGTTVETLASREPGFGTGALVTLIVGNGEFAGWLVIERNDNLGYDHLTRYCAVISADPVAVVWSGPVGEVEVQTWMPSPDGLPEWAQALAAAKWEAQRAEKAAAESHRALTKHKDRLEAIVDAAHEYADHNDLCSRFDEFMEANGLRPRSRDYDITVDVHLRIVVEQSGYDADAANENVTDDQIASEIYNLSQYVINGAIRDFDIVETEVKSR
ncbi:hypothetical protein [Mycolicibacterium llatzerense]|uniref:hypothetical protein n=1 Tax=Mycolicibacterium llatzerense TaxID=280871 RepID=UPI0021B6BE7B|nr:hypothetical protein [Mycolicibacterium llatzerense]MCT7372986.1 hypothetical protein [Mycolicibacterium llatzerense]